MWTCSKCDAKVDAGFEVCWRCGASAQGVEDPTFVTADEAGALPDASVTELGVSAPIPPADGEAAPDLVECYAARDYLEARFLADQLNERGIPAVADTFDMHETLGSMNASPRVRVPADRHAEARAWLEEYERHKGEPAAKSVLDE